MVRHDLILPALRKLSAIEEILFFEVNGWWTMEVRPALVFREQQEGLRERFERMLLDGFYCREIPNEYQLRAVLYNNRDRCHPRISAGFRGGSGVALYEILQQ